MTGSKAPDLRVMISGSRRAGMSMASFYHALDLASIEGLDCDIPLNIGFDIMRYVKTPDRGWGSGYGSSYRGPVNYVTHMGDRQSKLNRHQVSKAPRHNHSNSGAGYR